MLADRYRLDGRLGEGAMGVVWRAYDERLGRPVAIKELRAPVDADDQRWRAAARRMVREARSASLLKHPAVVTVHDVIEDGGRPWIVMELLNGRSLEQEPPMAPERAARVGLEVLAALCAAHAKGILHRDVKPANIFLRDDGRAVLTDFGIASLEGDESLTRSGVLIGSPAYMPPERARGEAGGPESDLWSLGATLYALVEGRPPFARATVMGTLGAVLTEEPDPPRAAGLLTPVILGLLARDPAVRLNAEGARAGLRAVNGETEPAIRPRFRPAAGPDRVAVPDRVAGPDDVAGDDGGVRHDGAAPQAGAAPRRDRRWTRPAVTVPALLVLMAGAVLLRVLAEGGDGDRRGDGGGGTSRTGPSVTATTTATTTASSTATAGRGAGQDAAPVARFGAPPDPCSLITAEQAIRYVRGPYQISSDSRDAGVACTWSTLGSGPRYTVEVSVQVTKAGFGRSAVDEAAERFAAQRETDAPIRGGATADRSVLFDDLSGLGDAAYLSGRLTDSSGRDGGSATLLVRISNLIMTVAHRSERLSRPHTGLRDDTVQLARWAEAELRR